MQDQVGCWCIQYPKSHMRQWYMETYSFRNSFVLWEIQNLRWHSWKLLHTYNILILHFSGIHIAGVSDKKVVSMHTEETEDRRQQGSPRAVVRDTTACPGHPGCPRRESAPHAGSDWVSEPSCWRDLHWTLLFPIYICIFFPLTDFILKCHGG